MRNYPTPGTLSRLERVRSRSKDPAARYALDVLLREAREDLWSAEHVWRRLCPDLDLRDKENALQSGLDEIVGSAGADFGLVRLRTIGTARFRTAAARNLPLSFLIDLDRSSTDVPTDCRLQEIAFRISDVENETGKFARILKPVARSIGVRALLGLPMCGMKPDAAGILLLCFRGPHVFLDEEVQAAAAAAAAMGRLLA